MRIIKQDVIIEWVNLYNNGYLIKDIAKKYGANRNTVSKKIKPLVKLRGRIKNYHEIILSKTIKKQNGCIEWTGNLNNKGYGCTTINGVRYLIHRYFYELEYGNIPNGFFCCHTCDNPKCVNPKHIFLGTNKDNLIDCAKKGRNRRKLNKKDIISIREMSKNKTPKELGVIFSVNESAIRKILKKERWAWV